MENKKEIYIVGGGWSLRNKNLKWLANKTTICINKSIFYVPYPDYFITMDFTFLNKIKKLKKYLDSLSTDKIFVVNFHVPYLKEENGQIKDIRGHGIIYNLKDFNIIIKSYNVNGIGFKWKDFCNGANSGYCGLQLAILLGFNKIHLLGIDFVIGKQTHFHGGYKESSISFQKKLDIYFEYWKKGLLELKEKRPDIKIISNSEISKLNGIIPYEKLK